MEPDTLEDVKDALLLIAMRSSKPQYSRIASLTRGKTFNYHAFSTLLIEFTESQWNVERAMARSPSLSRSVSRITSVLADYELRKRETLTKR
jgi:hypothetical protein